MRVSERRSEAAGPELDAKAASQPASLAYTALGYATGAAVVLVCSVLSYALAPVFGGAERILLFPFGVLLISARFGAQIALVTAVTGVLAFDFLFVPPLRSLRVATENHALTLVAMLCVSAVIAVLVGRLRRQAEFAQRQAEVERVRNALLMGLSHDLRTPLATVLGASTALGDDALDPAERKQLAGVVAAEAHRLHQLVSNLLELTRLESGRLRAKRTYQAIDEAIAAALARLEPRLAGRTVRTDVPQEVPLIGFDPVLIQQVLINLIENAVKHTPEGSPIEVIVRKTPREVITEVADRGPGVRPGEENKVFEPLYRSDPRGDGGFGLGLTVCRAVLTAHDGWIELENRTGGGACVRFGLPIRSESEAAEHANEEPYTTTRIV